MKTYYVYILSSKSRALYIGVTDNLVRRVWEYKEKKIEGFTKRYNIDRLVCYEKTNDIKSAIAREKCLKRWKREWKENLINEYNVEWKDLYNDLIQ